MEKEKNKYLYETTVKKEIVEQVTEEREENGEKIKITRDVKKVKPVKIAISKPDRKKYKDADIFYAKTLSNYLKEGLLPHSLVSKRYMNDGGPLTESEKKTLNVMRDRYVELQEEYFKMEGPLNEEQNKRRGEIILEMTEINRIVKEIKSSYSDIFENTAEAKTKNDTIEWWILNISMIEDEETKNYKLLYGDGDFDSKTEALEKLESKGDDFTNEVIKKLSYFISFWYSSGADISSEDFKSAEEHYEENVSLYMKDEIKEKLKKAISDLEEQEKTEELKKEEPKAEDPKVEEVKTEAPKQEESKENSP